MNLEPTPEGARVIVAIAILSLLSLTAIAVALIAHKHS